MRAHAHARHAAGFVEQPPRHRAVIGAKGPAIAARQIGKIEIGMVRPAQPVARADGGQIRHHCVIARQHQMIAVIDHAGKLRIVVAAATPTRLCGTVCHVDDNPGARQFNSGRQPGHPRADDMGFHATCTLNIPSTRFPGEGRGPVETPDIAVRNAKC